MTLIIDREGNQFNMEDDRGVNLEIIKYVNCIVPEDFLEIDKTKLEELLSKQCSQDSLREVIVAKNDKWQVEDDTPMPEYNFIYYERPFGITTEIVKKELKKRSDNYFKN